VPTAVSGVIGNSLGSVSVRSNTTCAKHITGVPYCWGFNGNGQVGDNSTTNRSTYVPLVPWPEGTPGTPVYVTIISGNGQSATVNTNVATAPSVTVRDYLNNPVAGVTVTFTIALGGGSLTGGTAVTDASGNASVGSWTLGATAGFNWLQATVAGVGYQIITATGTP
jgi:hypothetical protein